MKRTNHTWAWSSTGAVGRCTRCGTKTKVVKRPSKKNAKVKIEERVYSIDGFKTHQSASKPSCRASVMAPEPAVKEPEPTVLWKL